MSYEQLWASHIIDVRAYLAIYGSTRVLDATGRKLGYFQ